MEQLLLHLIGDYLTQSEWMAQNKRLRDWPAFVHVSIYSAPFALLVNWSSLWGVLAWWTIFWSHFYIDRYGLARYVVWAKNWMGAPEWWLMTEELPDDYPHSLLADGHLPERQFWQARHPTPAWRFCTKTGYPPGRPEWLSMWLLIIADNTLHLAINYAALRWL
jgi:hypothetical protein